MLERATLLTDHQQEIKLDSLFPQHKDVESTSDSTDMNINIDELLTEHFSLEQFEQDIIRMAMDKSRQNVSEAARILGISRATLDYRLKKIDLP